MNIGYYPLSTQTGGKAESLQYWSSAVWGPASGLSLTAKPVKKGERSQLAGDRPARYHLNRLVHCWVFDETCWLEGSIQNHDSASHPPLEELTWSVHTRVVFQRRLFEKLAPVADTSNYLKWQFEKALLETNSHDCSLSQNSVQTASTLNARPTSTIQNSPKW